MTSVDVVINYNVPTTRRTIYIASVELPEEVVWAKPSSSPQKYDVEFLVRMEKVLEQKLELWPTDKDVLLLRDHVYEAGRLTVNELKGAGQDEAETSYE